MKKLNLVTMATVTVLMAGGVLQANQMTDRIESSAKKSYIFKTYLKDDDIKIHAAKDSIVTLTGTVTEWSHRLLAEQTVANLRGVLRVENKLEVHGGQPPETSDVWVSIKVKSSLMFHRNVSGLATDIDVKDKIVTLRGQASSEAQKELTTEYVKDVEGVQGVKNDMTIEKAGKTTIEKAGEYLDDASITAQVKLALLFHRSTSAANTKIETKDGVVTVGGIAKNSAEKDLVGKLITDIKGVKSLKNRMSII
jgi:hyperosmotically inducible periplasmic protein